MTGTQDPTNIYVGSTSAVFYNRNTTKLMKSRIQKHSNIGILDYGNLQEHLYITQLGPEGYTSMNTLGCGNLQAYSFAHIERSLQGHQEVWPTKN